MPPRRIVRFQIGASGAEIATAAALPKSIITAHVGEVGKGTQRHVRAFLFILDPDKEPTARDREHGDPRAWVYASQHSQISGLTQTPLFGRNGMQLLRGELPQGCYLRYYTELNETVYGKTRRCFSTLICCTTGTSPFQACIALPNDTGNVFSQIEGTLGAVLPKEAAFVQEIPGASGKFCRSTYAKGLRLDGQMLERYVYTTRCTAPTTPQHQWITLRQDPEDRWKRWALYITPYRGEDRPLHLALFLSAGSPALSRYMSLQNALVEVTLFAAANQWHLEPWEVQTLPT